MLSRVFCVIALALGCTVFLTGAWPGISARTAEKHISTFVAQAIPLNPDIVGESVNAVELVAKALAALDPNNVRWLSTRIRQTTQTPHSNFIAEGSLHRAVGHCARLEMTVGTGKWAGRLLVVSDGRVVARLRESPWSAPNTEIHTLPENDAAKLEALASHGCDSPRAMLRKVQPHLQDATLSTGMLDAEPVIRIRAALKDQTLSPDLKALGDLHCCQIFLDANTLWPICIEWTILDANQSPRTALRVEFLEPSINRELDHATCDQLFSYQPIETTAATK